jgi:hypothetical protein
MYPGCLYNQEAVGGFHMLRVLGGSALGAIIGAAVLAAVASFGAEPAITIPLPQASGGVHPETISLASVVGKLAVILGVCTGALVGALAGVAATREALPGPASSAGRVKRP